MCQDPVVASAELAAGQDRIEIMIKGVTFLRPAATDADYQKLSSFFASVGFGLGRGWSDETSRGASFLAPLANVEFVCGEMPQTAGILIEVTQLDAAHQATLHWAESVGADAATLQLTDPAETHWNSRLFSVEPVPGHLFSFWEWSDPLRGRPVAIEGDLSAVGMRFGIVVARWNAVITDRLLEGALDALLRSGAGRRHIQIVRVPGAWEIPAAARMLAELPSAHEKAVDAVIALGCLLRGETAHYEAIYNEVARGIGQSQQETGVPHAFGVLTCETLEQALNRAGIKAGNKGFEAAIAAIEMVSVRHKLHDGEGA